VLRPGFHSVRRFVGADENRVPERAERSVHTGEGKGEEKMNQSSLAIPRSLQHRINALLLHPSVAVGIPLGSKNVCSPRATETSLFVQGNVSKTGKAEGKGKERTVLQQQDPTPS
jgi:hypothetical protein